MLDPPTGGALTMTSTYQTRCTVTVGLLHRHRSGHFPFIDPKGAKFERVNLVEKGTCELGRPWRRDVLM